MDKKFLKEKNLYEAHKQFMRLCEWTTLGQMVEEDDDETPQDDPIGGDAMDGSQENKMPQDGGMGAEGGAPIGNDMNSNEEMPQDGGMDINGSDSMDGTSMSTMDSPMGGDTMGNDPMGGDTMGNDPMGGEDETVIDVEDITNAQEKMNDKVNVVGQDLGKVDSKIEALLQTLSKMETMINNNNQEIANFKAEFEKRNPTQTEKLNLRSLDSYPFNVNPKDYWAQKGADPNSNYSGFSNNGEPTTQEYVITNNDVDDFSEREMEKSFDIADDLRQDINKIFGI
jgi:hypothetical protein